MVKSRLSTSCDVSVASAVEGDSSPAEHFDDERKTLARTEDKAVRYLRWVVLVLLLVTATGVSTGCLLYMKAAQNEAFVAEYEMFAIKILKSFQQSVSLKQEAMEALSLTFTSYARGTGATFPNITLPDFEVRGTSTRILAQAEIITYSPVVTDKTRVGWEAFALRNRDYLVKSQESNVYQPGAHDGYSNYTEKHPGEAYEFHDRIFDVSHNGSIYDAPINSGPYLPVWLSTPFPLTKGLLNFNMLSLPAARAYKAVVGSGKSVVDLAENLNEEQLGETSANLKLVLSMRENRDDSWPLSDPSSPFGYPVFDSFDPEKRKVAGLLATNLYWKHYLENIVTEKARGIICVWQNTAGQSFTYRVDGAQATYLGKGDLHEPHFDGMMRSALFSSSLDPESTAAPEIMLSTSVPLDLDYLDYTLFVYPSNDTKAEYTSNSPVIAFVVVACAFLFTSIVFVSYDCFVARRQRIVMNRAIASGAIVSSLFPAQVRDQVYEEREEQEKKRLSNQFSGEGKPNTFGDDVEANRRSRPIAEKFENTTILFADLAGFTKWSSTRNPEEVFVLLETLYSAFDEIALRRKVFKVETIGDCYVAATGVPDPQPDNAVIMCKFAHECMESMAKLLPGLADSLGADTSSLEMRVGMHSGPITGGVLRGAKSRFQLFGDTINTASRMESNGVRGRIHVSQQTADELIARGKQAWILPREDKIVAKGKGELQTYFVNPAVRDEPKE